MTKTAYHNVEAPSGKDAAYENFPVGSWLLPAALRPHIATFYHYARAIDDIADSPDLPPDEKIARLDGFAAAIQGADQDDPAYAKGHRMRESLAETGADPQHCLDLIAAFKQDAVKLRYQDWDDLVGYCVLSAAPVGRYLLDLHGGSNHGYGPSDALCIALQVINHLQDCQDDYRQLNRVYLPQDWMAEEGAVDGELTAGSCSPALRRVLDRTLSATETLLRDAQALPGGLASKRLAMESAFILVIARRLVALLRTRDPLAVRVQLSKPDYLWCGVRGILSVLF
ncbi:MAG: squalene synthase HpnC [Rhodospirillales bacterium]|nr:squalene synthase HpnC [Rhodospirillales bacterium]